MSADGDSMIVLLVDGSPPVRGADMEPIVPRERLFSAVAPHWPRLRVMRPEEALREVNARLVETNRRLPSRMYGSAACVRIDLVLGRLEAAEAGDTKLWRATTESRWEPLILTGLPGSEGETGGVLGQSASVEPRTRLLRTSERERITLMTDGAYHMLAAAGCIAAAGRVDASLPEAFDDIVAPPEDDATLVVLSFGNAAP